MPTFIFTSPEGKEYEVDGPDGATEAQAFQVLQQQLGGGAMAQERRPAGKSWEEIAKINAKDAPQSLGRTIIDQGLQGIPLVGSYTDEVTSGLGGLMASAVTGESPLKLAGYAAQMRNPRLEAQQEQNPKTALASQLASGILGAATVGQTGVGQNIISRLGAGGLPARIAKGAGAGAVGGAIYGAGVGEGEQGTAENAIAGGGLGGILGGALPVVARVGGAALTAGKRQIEKLVGELPAEKASPAMKKIFNKLSEDYTPDELRSVLNSYASKPGATLLEKSGKATKLLGETASQFPSGGARAAEFFEKKVSEAPAVLKQSISKNLSPDFPYYQTIDDVVEAGRQKAKPLYSAAFKSNPSIDSPTIKRVLRSPEGRNALSIAVRNMQNELTNPAVKDPELTAALREAVALGKAKPSPGGVASGLKLKTLDYIKKAMDLDYRRAERAAISGSGDPGEPGRILNLKNLLVNEMDAMDKTGLYAKARKTSGDYLSSRAAMEAGRNFLNDDREIIQRTFKDFSPAERAAYKFGAATRLREDINKTTDGRNVARFFSTPETRNKLASILKPKEFESLLADAKATDEIYKLRNQLTGNSRTALRQLGAQDFEDDVAALSLDVAKKGVSRAVIDKTIGYVGRRLTGVTDKVADDVAQILFEQDPKRKYQIVKQLNNQLRAAPSEVRNRAGKTLELFYGASDLLGKAQTNAVLTPLTVQVAE